MDVTGAGGVRLVVTDHGGSGPAIVLMHGLGLRRTSMDRVASLLTGWRVVTMDLRGHGDSATAPWSMEAAVSDVACVVAALGLERPYVAGHSLGGMVALRCAIAGQAVAGAVNIDGWGPGVESRFVGEDPALVAAALDRYAAGHLPLAARVLTARSRQTREGTTARVMAELRDADVVAWHRSAPCPSLAVHAVAPAGRATGLLMGSEMVRLQAAHHAGLRRDLAVVAAERDDVMVVEVEATHGLFRTHPGDVASAIEAFASSVDGG